MQDKLENVIPFTALCWNHLGFKWPDNTNAVYNMCSSMPVQPSVTNVPQYSMHSTYGPENKLQKCEARCKMGMSK